MKEVVLEKLDLLGESPIELNYKNTKKIYQYMPVPNNYKIYWADMSFGNNPLGIVITDNGIVTKYQQSEKEINKKGKSENVKKELFRILRWDHVEVNKFQLKLHEGRLKIYYHSDLLIEMDNNNNVVKYFNEMKKEIEKYTLEFNDGLSLFSDINKESTKEAIDTVIKINNDVSSIDSFKGDVKIQTYYCESAEKFINQFFNEENDFLLCDSKQKVKNIRIEVPKDIYIEVVKLMSEKIKEGMIPGITSSKEAINIVRKGKLTYRQAKNIAKSRIFKEISYDEEHGTVNCYFELGMTFLVAWNTARSVGKKNEEALQYALATGIEVFGISFIDSFIDAQISASSINEIVKEISDYIVEKIGHKATHAVVHSIREVAGKHLIIRGSLGKYLVKVFRLNAIVQALTFIIFSVPNTYRVLNKRISGSQYLKNISSLMGGMIAAGFGVWGASFATSEIAIDLGTTAEPMVSTVGFVAGAVAGITGSDITKVIGDLIVEDDKVRLTRMYNEIINHLIIDYMLTEKEIHLLVSRLNEIDNRAINKMFKDLLASNNQENHIIDYVDDYFYNIVKTRPMLQVPREEEIISALKLMKVNF